MFLVDSFMKFHLNYSVALCVIATQFCDSGSKLVVGRPELLLLVRRQTGSYYSSFGSCMAFFSLGGGFRTIWTIVPSAGSMSRYVRRIDSMCLSQ